MSVSFESWETGAEEMSRYLHLNLSPYYDQTYLDVLCDVICRALSTTRYSIAVTLVSLPEPLASFRNMVIISLPLFVQYINSPILDTSDSIAHVSAFDVFDILEVNDDETFHKEMIDFVSDRDKVIHILLMRIFLLVSHWIQHHQQSADEPKNQFTHNADSFHELEMAIE
jgi:hypothetical protein